MKLQNIGTKKQGGWVSALIGAGASLLGGAFSGKSASHRNRMSRAEAQRNRDFQERMSSTSHQREVTDLRAAGLNPILSATGGSGSSSPAGNMAPIENEGQPAINTAMSLARLAAEIKNIDATTTKTKAETINALNKTSVTETQAHAARIIDSGLGGIKNAGDWLGTNTAKAQNAVQNLLNSISQPTTSDKKLHIRVNKQYTKKDLANMSPRKRAAILKARKAKNYKGK